MWSGVHPLRKLQGIRMYGRLLITFIIPPFGLRRFEHERRIARSSESYRRPLLLVMPRIRRVAIMAVVHERMVAHEFPAVLS